MNSRNRSIALGALAAFCLLGAWVAHWVTSMPRPVSLPSANSPPSLDGSSVMERSRESEVISTRRFAPEIAGKSRIRIRVSDQNSGEPIVRARARYYRGRTRNVQPACPELTAHADASGVLDMESPDPGGNEEPSLGLVVDFPGYIPGYIDDPTAGIEYSLGLDRGVRAVIRTIDRENSPIRDSRVYLSRFRMSPASVATYLSQSALSSIPGPGGASIHAAVTDDAGMAHFHDLPQGPLYCWIEHDRYIPIDYEFHSPLNPDTPLTEQDIKLAELYYLACAIDPGEGFVPEVVTRRPVSGELTLRSYAWSGLVAQHERALKKALRDQGVVKPIVIIASPALSGNGDLQATLEAGIPGAGLSKSRTFSLRRVVSGEPVLETWEIWRDFPGTRTDMASVLLKMKTNLPEPPSINYYVIPLGNGDRPDMLRATSMAFNEKKDLLSGNYRLRPIEPHWNALLGAKDIDLRAGQDMVIDVEIPDNIIKIRCKFITHPADLPISGRLRVTSKDATYRLGVHEDRQTLYLPRGSYLFSLEAIGFLPVELDRDVQNSATVEIHLERDGK